MLESPGESLDNHASSYGSSKLVSHGSDPNVGVLWSRVICFWILRPKSSSPRETMAGIELSRYDVTSNLRPLKVGTTGRLDCGSA